MLDEVDPVPTDLVERMQFALALDEVFAEVAEMTRMPRTRSRSALTRPGHPHRDADVLGRATHRDGHGVRRGTGSGAARRLGRPAGVRRVAVRMQGSDARSSTDESGRFVVDALRKDSCSWSSTR